MDICNLVIGKTYRLINVTDKVFIATKMLEPTSRCFPPADSLRLANDFEFTVVEVLKDPFRYRVNINTGDNFYEDYWITPARLLSFSLAEKKEVTQDGISSGTEERRASTV